MPLSQWGEPECPALQPGHALFDTTTPWHHSMVAASGSTVSASGGQEFMIHHMAPPLVSKLREIAVLNSSHWLGWFEEIDVDALQEISHEATRLIHLVKIYARKLSRYDLNQHEVFEEDPNDRGLIPTHASCASFLEHCYQTQGVDLVASQAVPEVESIQKLAELVEVEDVEELEKQLRLGVPPRWPCHILFPGYQMRAFQQPFSNLPYSPSLKDHRFEESAATEVDTG